MLWAIDLVCRAYRLQGRAHQVYINCRCVSTFWPRTRHRGSSGCWSSTSVASPDGKLHHTLHRLAAKPGPRRISCILMLFTLIVSINVSSITMSLVSLASPLDALNYVAQENFEESSVQENSNHLTAAVRYSRRQSKIWLPLYWGWRQSILRSDKRLLYLARNFCSKLMTMERHNCTAA